MCCPHGRERGVKDRPQPSLALISFHALCSNAVQTPRNVSNQWLFCIPRTVSEQLRGS